MILKLIKNEIHILTDLALILPYILTDRTTTLDFGLQVITILLRTKDMP